MRVFNKKWTRRLEACGDPKDFMILKPYAFADVPDKYIGDITFKLGVQAGDIEVIETKKQEVVFENEPKAAAADAQEMTQKAAKKGGAKKGNA